MAKIGIIKDKDLSYDCKTPFHPARNYPEYPFGQFSEKNAVYNAVRELFHQMGLDNPNYNHPSWNPLGETIKPGNTILLKPNWVKHFNVASEIDCMLTHSSVVRAVLDYAYIALKGQGRIIIADASIQECDFKKLVAYTGLNELARFYNENASLKVEVGDLRLTASHKSKSGAIVREQLHGDKSGYVAVDLKDRSQLYPIREDYKKFRVTCYDKEEMILHHNKEKNEYLIPKSVLESDVIINLPKLKTHRKAGMTCSLKNIVGINGCKDWLPHHRFGSTEEGGDEYLYKSLRKKLATKLIEKRDVAVKKYWAGLLTLMVLLIRGTNRIIPPKDSYLEGSWYGNDTLARTIADLNKIAFYADRNGVLQETVQRKMLIVVDAIIAGEREGPLEPHPKPCGLLVAGYNPLLVDLVCSRIMGFDYQKMPHFKHTLKSISSKSFHQALADIEFTCGKCNDLDDVYTAYGDDFIPTKGWRGHVEL